MHQVVLHVLLLLQGTLREALDKRRLLQPGQAVVAPAAVTLLLRDVAAAMLHLHSEGVIHGDLKAANVSIGSSRSAGAIRRGRPCSSRCA
jgi:serine/threonine protein kinase